VRTAAAVSGDTTRRDGAVGSSRRVPSGPTVASTRRGGRVSPPLAMVVNTSSICIGVTAMPFPIGIEARLVALYSSTGSRMPVDSPG
jgi:hypothetical protein